MGPATTEAGYPPPGIPWETDVEVALREAGRRRVPVFVLVSNKGCPHSRKMSQDFWPDAGVQRALGRVVPLFVHRNSGQGSSLGAIRFNILGYPRMFFLDSRGCFLVRSVARDARGFPAAVDRAVSLSRGQAKVHRPGLVEYEMPPYDLAAARRLPDLVERFRHQLPQAAALATALESEEDAPTQVLLLRGLLHRARTGATLSPRTLARVRRLARAPNDHVKLECYALLEEVGEEEELSTLRAELEDRRGSPPTWNRSNLDYALGRGRRRR